MQGNIEHVAPLSIEEVSRIHFRGGSYIGISRANPTLDPQHLENTVISLLRLNVSRLITIGGEDARGLAVNLADELAVPGLRITQMPDPLSGMVSMWLDTALARAPIEAVQADSRFGSYLCSILKTSLELALSGRLELDMFVTHPICDAARNLAAVWGRNLPYPCRILYLPQNANSSYAPNYLCGEYDRVYCQSFARVVQGEIILNDPIFSYLRSQKWQRAVAFRDLIGEGRHSDR